MLDLPAVTIVVPLAACTLLLSGLGASASPLYVLLVTLALIATHAGRTRLIDNLLFGPDGREIDAERLYSSRSA